uniref:Uncharacterized protein n=1 Tax=Cyanidium sp. THAL103 TaxID=3027999 RepID=A0A9Y1I400_9RHOD|nr:hypothetical protein CspTHAL103_045 [Cyanidium sp. THAL103]
MNILSLPTWIIHIGTLLEWLLIIDFIDCYIMINPNERSFYNYKFLILANSLALSSGFIACIWHIFNNYITLNWLIIFQAMLTFLSNFFLFIALYQHNFYRNYE